MQEKKQIHIQVKDKIATFVSMNFTLVGGNSDYEVVFDFDSDWSAYPTKTALFVYADNTRKVVFNGNICKGVSIENATMCLIGVFADDIATTTPACIKDVRHSIRDVATSLPEPPTEDVYNQIMELLNRYINEASGIPSGGAKGQVLKKASDNDFDAAWQDDEKGTQISEDDILSVVKQYIEQNPPQDGFSPTVNIIPVDNGYTVNITDKNDVHSYTLYNGLNGKSAYEYAKEGGYTGTEVEFSQKLAKEIPAKVSDLENDKNFIDATGAPVQSVNDKTGNINLSASDVGARPSTWTPTAEEVGADKKGTASSLVSIHNTDSESHNDIRLLIEGLNSRLNALANSEDVDLDQMKELVDYIKANRGLIEQITTNKVNYTDIIDNLTTNVKDKPLSAAQGVALKALIDALGTGKLDASELSNAINTALAQAKASGEFDGADGKTPYIQNGYWYIDGVNTNVKAEGKDGKDYVITDADYSQIAAIVLEMLGGEPIHGVVDENNHITLKGVDAGGKYTFSFVTEEGELIYGGEFVYDTNTYYEVTTPTLTNCRFDGSATAIKGQGYEATITAYDGYELSALTATMEGGGTITADKATGKISTNNVTGDIVITAVATATATVTPANFCVPNGDGWITNGRCSSSGEDRTNGVSGWHCSNYISVQNGDIVYVENADLCTLTNQYCGMYKPDKTAIGGFMINNGAGYVKDVDLTSEVENFTIDNANAGYVRVVLKPHSTNDDIVIKIKRNGEWLTA